MSSSARYRAAKPRRAGTGRGGHVLPHRGRSVWCCTGSGGSPYTSGSSSSRKNAPPPRCRRRVSSTGAPGLPASCSASTAAGPARAARPPAELDRLGRAAWAQAGSSPSPIRRSTACTPGPAVPFARSMTPGGQAETQYPQPLQTSTGPRPLPNSLRISAPVGHKSGRRTRAVLAHLLAMSQREPSAENSQRRLGEHRRTGVIRGHRARDRAGGSPGRLICSMNATCRQVEAPRLPVLSYGHAQQVQPSSGPRSMSFRPLRRPCSDDTEVSVKNPIRGGCCS